MIFRNTEVAGARIVELEPHTDERGFFARSFCADEFDAAGIAMTVVQANISRNRRRGTLRGVRWNDPAFTIVWPFAPKTMSDKDATYPDFDPQTMKASKS